MKKVSIHQPEFLPWCGFFDKIMSSDVMILYDLAQYNKQDFQNRNYVMCNNEPKYIIVPIKKCKTSTLIKDVQIANEMKWQKKIKEQISHYYCKAKYFDEIYSLLSIIWEREWIYLSQLNIVLINKILGYLNIKVDILIASDMVDNQDLFLEKNASEKNFLLCQQVEADVYVSGGCGRNYLITDIFDENNVLIEYHKYRKLEKVNLSIIDYLFNYGKETLEIMFK